MLHTDCQKQQPQAERRQIRQNHIEPARANFHRLPCPEEKCLTGGCGGNPEKLTAIGNFVQASLLNCHGFVEARCPRAMYEFAAYEFASDYGCKTQRYSDGVRLVQHRFIKFEILTKDLGTCWFSVKIKLHGRHRPCVFMIMVLALLKCASSWHILCFTAFEALKKGSGTSSQMAQWALRTIGS